jgi:DNA-binding beta-propeller fold protein YncE
MPQPRSSVTTSNKERVLSEPIIVGNDEFQFEADNTWAQVPAEAAWQEAVGVAADSTGRVYVFNRGPLPIVVLDRDGSFIGGWGQGLFNRPHGIVVDDEDNLLLTDDMGHSVRKYSPDGVPLMDVGPCGTPSETGVEGMDFRTIRAGCGPYNIPTNLAIAPDGELYVADGYGNASIHRFTPGGELIQSWGSPGDGPGEFNVPHGIAVDQQGQVIVADRENSRIQFFTPDGTLSDTWTHVVRPTQVVVDQEGNLWISELGTIAGLFPFMDPPDNPVGSRVSVFSSSGDLLVRWGGGADPGSPGDFFAAHDLWLDPFGDLYVSEVVYSAGGKHGMVPADCPSLQKFTRIHSESGAS